MSRMKGLLACFCLVVAGCNDKDSDNQDRTAPAAPQVSSPADGLLTDSQIVQFTGTAEADTTVTVALFDADGDETGVGGTATADGDGNWSFTTTGSLPDGTYEARITATDAAGNESTAAVLTVTIDTTAPAAPTLTGTLPSYVSSGTLVLDGSGNVGDTIVVYDGTSQIGTATVGPNGSWTITTSPLSDGQHTLTAYATDPAGNQSAGADLGDVEVDTIAPTVTVDTLAASTATPQLTGSVNDTGSGVDTVVVSVDGVDYNATLTGGAWMADVTTALADGTYDVVATATDLAGNTGNDATTNELEVSVPVPQVTLTSSLGGQTFYAGDQQEITWTSSDVTGTVDLHYTLNGSAGTPTWTAIALDEADDGSFTWTIPSQNTTDCLVRVSMSDGSASDTSDAPFTLAQPQVQVVSPNGGELLYGNDTVTVEWTSDGVGTVDIFYATDASDAAPGWTSIASGLSSPGTFVWTVPPTASSDCAIRIVALDAGAEDISDATFEIAVRSITLTAPNGGETAFWDDTMAITWDSTHAPSVELAYTLDYSGASTWIDIATVPGTAGSHDWVVPHEISSDCRIRATIAGTTTADVSDGAFQIQERSITVNAPTAGEVLYWDHVETIAWSSVNLTGTVDIQYATSVSSPVWQSLGTADVSAGTFAWTIPNEDSTECMVRVRSSHTPTEGQSPVFTMAPPSVQVDAPNGGVFYWGETVQVRWSSVGAVTDMTVEYALDAASPTWTVLSSAANSNGVTDWVIPEVESTQCVVRARTLDGYAEDISDVLFEIRKPAITIHDPSDGERVLVGGYEVTFSAQGAAGLRILFSDDTGSSWSLIGVEPGTATSHNWSIDPADRSATCLLRIEDSRSSAFAQTGPFIVYDGIWHVDADAPPGGDGVSWARAFKNPQAALAMAGSTNEEIWVAEGTYYPTSGSDQTVSFVMDDHMDMYGGFAGTETLRNARDWVAHPTVLSGDIGVPNDGNDNSWHVLRGANSRLDGFQIRGGRAAGPGFDRSKCGGGMLNQNCSPVISQCLFIDNTAEFGGAMYNGPGNPTIEAEFTGNMARLGGAVHSSYSQPVFVNALVHGNTAEQGGAFYCFDSTTTFTNMTLRNNIATDLPGDTITSDCHGGGVYVSYGHAEFNQCDFIRNHAEDAGMGGAAYVVNGTAVFTDCDLERNTANEADGGAVSADTSNVTFNGCAFLQNEAGANGGALYTVESQASVSMCLFQSNSALPSALLMSNGGGVAFADGHLLVNDSTFTDNFGIYGAGLHGKTTTGATDHRLEMNNCTFTNHDADMAGGALALAVDSTVTGCTIVGNTGDGGGGAFLNDAEFVFDSCLFTDNTANNGGGGIHLVQDGSITLLNCTLKRNASINEQGGGAWFGPNTTATLTGTDFVENVSPDGAGVYVEDASVTLNSCDFVSQSSSNDGGGVYSSNSDVVATDCLFQDNAATDYGGAIWQHLGSCTLTDCSLSGNTAAWAGGGLHFHSVTAECRGCQFDSNSATNVGGGLWAISGSTLIQDCTAVDNQADQGGFGYTTSSVLVQDSTFTANVAATQGGAFRLTNAPLNASNSRFTANAAEEGGAVWLGNSTPSTIQDCDFFGTSQAMGEIYGGAIRSEDSDVTVEGCSFEACHVSTHGGAISAEATVDCNLVVRDSTFTNAKAGGGGCIACVGASLTVESCLMTASTAEDGAAICSDSTTSVQGTTFVNLEAFQGHGGAACIVHADSTWQGCHFELCQAYYRGGALYVEEGTATVTSCSFNSCTANYEGGGIMCERASITLSDTAFTLNEADLDGGGFHIMDGAAEVDACTFDSNLANAGGGISHDSTAPLLVTNSSFNSNSALEDGGGIYSISNVDAELTGCIFEQNEATRWGGGMLLFRAKALNCVFADNTSGERGGGANCSSLDAENCVFAGNIVSTGNGGGVYTNHLQLDNSTFTENDASNLGGAAIVILDGNAVANCIFWGNTALGGAEIYCDAPSDMLVSHSLLDITRCYQVLDDDCLNTAPIFVDPSNRIGPDGIWRTWDDGLQLDNGSTPSPCIDAGDNALVPPTLTEDITNRSRLVDGDGDTVSDVDMGAYEYQ